MSADDPEQAMVGARPGTALIVAIGACVLILVLGVRWVRDKQVERASLPAFQGSLVAPLLEQRVHVRRDTWGVPHIAANSESDAWFALGFVHAQDRLAQMLWLRQLGRGRAAEWLGETGLASDRFARTVDFVGNAQRVLGELPDETRLVLERYAQGVSLRIDRVRSGESGVPVALSRLSVQREAIEPWTAFDSLVIFKLLSWGSGASIEAASVLDQLTQRLGGVGARPFEPQGEGLQTVAVSFAPPAMSPRLDRSPALRADSFVPKLYGGTAWVLAGRHTASGLPIVAADWQIAPTAPSLLHQSHVRCPSIEWAGAFVPGIPIAWLGRNASVAWALLPARAVTTGFFEETLRAREPASLYHDGRSWQPVHQRVETIRVRQSGGELQEQEWLVAATRHGPLVDPLFEGQHAPLALAWTGARSGDGLTSLIGIPRSDSSQQLRARLQDHHEPVVAAVFADAAGAGGLQVAGWLPRRVLPTSLQPVPGRLRSYDWTVRIPYDELPSAALVAPEDARPGDLEPDWLAVSDAGWSGKRTGAPEDAEWLWRSGRRAARLDRLLGRFVARGRVDLRDVVEIQRDTVAAGGTAFVRSVVAIIADVKLAPEESEMLEILRGWDGDLRPASRAGAVHAVLLEELSEAFFARPMSEPLFERYRSLPQARISNVTRGVVLAAALSPDAAGWADPERVRPLVREALRRTWARLVHELGPNRERWSWGRLQNARFGRFAPFGPGGVELDGPLGGGESSLATAAHDSSFRVVRATTYRMAVDLSVSEEMLATLAPGQLEHATHPHYGDAVGQWRAGHPTVLRTAPGLIDATQERVLALEPPP